MNIPGITWKGESIEDVEILRELPADLVRVLSDTNRLCEADSGPSRWDKGSVYTHRLMANQASAGNGAVAFWFHTGSLRRAVPEMRRSP
jgi:hypothetical protein